MRDYYASKSLKKTFLNKYINAIRIKHTLVLVAQPRNNEHMKSVPTISVGSRSPVILRLFQLAQTCYPHFSSRRENGARHGGGCCTPTRLASGLPFGNVYCAGFRKPPCSCLRCGLPRRSSPRTGPNQIQILIGLSNTTGWSARPCAPEGSRQLPLEVAVRWVRASIY